ncbi:hypothetical protein XACW160_750101 [Xanthomonas citri pv. citri]|nr:hypothetical protein XAC902_1070099 [Xanthomonas citri pv. citri]CEE77604.1 hypothetical protein XACW160_750101 [Xanthomonas citri pv. citri]CEH64103.1 hypothetical protein XACLG97_9330012 [Xanthomonas citri pv. citri]CEJ21048.1 hypothetical protein XACE116_10360007 [Xanthomonas citri pv. citri]CEJ25638.1 hypothetical protein XACE116_10360007 [Xanthomonas citri pv. citri]
MMLNWAVRQAESAKSGAPQSALARHDSGARRQI